jgi:hypothetical protein
VFLPNEANFWRCLWFLNPLTDSGLRCALGQFVTWLRFVKIGFVWGYSGPFAASVWVPVGRNEAKLPGDGRRLDGRPSVEYGAGAGDCRDGTERRLVRLGSRTTKHPDICASPFDAAPFDFAQGGQGRQKRRNRQVQRAALVRLPLWPMAI